MSHPPPHTSAYENDLTSNLNQKPTQADLGTALINTSLQRLAPCARNLK
jgi:hypothetical protein